MKEQSHWDDLPKDMEEELVAELSMRELLEMEQPEPTPPPPNAGVKDERWGGSKARERGREKTQILLRHLGSFGVIDEPVIEHLLGISNRSARRTLDNMVERKLIRHEPADSCRQKLYHLTPFGRRQAQGYQEEFFQDMSLPTSPSRIRHGQASHDLLSGLLAAELASQVSGIVYSSVELDHQGIGYGFGGKRTPDSRIDYTDTDDTGRTVIMELEQERKDHDLIRRILSGYSVDYTVGRISELRIYSTRKSSLSGWERILGQRGYIYHRNDDHNRWYRDEYEDDPMTDDFRESVKVILLPRHYHDLYYFGP